MNSQRRQCRARPGTGSLVARLAHPKVDALINATESLKWAKKRAPYVRTSSVLFAQREHSYRANSNSTELRSNF